MAAAMKFAPLAQAGRWPSSRRLVRFGEAAHHRLPDRAGDGRVIAEQEA